MRRYFQFFILISCFFTPAYAQYDTSRFIQVEQLAKLWDVSINDEDIITQGASSDESSEMLSIIHNTATLSPYIYAGNNYIIPKPTDNPRQVFEEYYGGFVFGLKEKYSVEKKTVYESESLKVYFSKVKNDVNYIGNLVGINKENKVYVFHFMGGFFESYEQFNSFFGNQIELIFDIEK